MLDSTHLTGFGSGSSAAGPAAVGVQFDGTNDYLAVTGTPIPDNSVGLTFSGWLRMNVGSSDSTDFAIANTGNTNWFEFKRAADGALNMILYDTSSTDIISQDGGALVDDSTWHHVMWSFKASATADFMCYRDGVDITNVGSGPTAGTMNTGVDNWNIGHNATNQKWPGDMAQIYFTDEFIDLDVAANRLKFYNAGSSVDLGSDGSTPTGTAARIFLNAEVDSWHTNLGSGGGFTETGALTAAATNP